MLAKDLVEVIKTIYPSYSKVTHAMVENGERYGVRLTPEAERLLKNRFGSPSKPRTPKKKTHRLTVSEDAYEQLTKMAAESGESIKQYIERLIEKGEHDVRPESESI